MKVKIRKRGQAKSEGGMLAMLLCLSFIPKRKKRDQIHSTTGSDTFGIHFQPQKKPF